MAEALVDAAAMDDLEDIIDHMMLYGGQDRALRFSDTFFEAVTALETYPDLGSPDPDQFLAARGYRRLSLGDHWCYYVVENGTVTVRRILRKGRLSPAMP